MRNSELPVLIDRFVEVVNRGDTKSFLDFFTSDGIVYDSGRRFDGQEAIRKWSDREFIGAKGQIAVKDIEQTKNGFLVKADWTSNYFTGPSRFTFVLQDKKIRELRISGE
jgi:SnoaL-like protein